MSNIQGKVWGRTETVFAKNNVEVHRIEGKAGGHCSKHCHENKWNMFYVERGELIINTWMDYGLVDITVLGPGQSTSVPPKRCHRFTVGAADTVAYEIYWTELDPHDIKRDDVGGFGDS